MAINLKLGCMEGTAGMEIQIQIPCRRQETLVNVQFVEPALCCGEWLPSAVIVGVVHAKLTEASRERKMRCCEA